MPGAGALSRQSRQILGKIASRKPREAVNLGEWAISGGHTISLDEAGHFWVRGNIRWHRRCGGGKKGMIVMGKGANRGGHEGGGTLKHELFN